MCLNIGLVALAVADYCSTVEAEKRPLMLVAQVIGNGATFLFSGWQYYVNGTVFKALYPENEELLDDVEMDNGPLQEPMAVVVRVEEA